MKSFSPTTLAELQENLHQLTACSKILSGGTDLIIQLHSGKVKPDALCYLGYLPELKTVALEGDQLSIGAMVTMAELEKHSTVLELFPALSDAAGDVGSPQIRNNATIGGNIANASPAADLSPVLYLYSAQAEVMGPEGRILLPIQEVLLGSGKTCLKHNQVITRFLLPVPDFKSAFLKLGSRAKVTISRIGLALGLVMKGDKVVDIHLFVGAVSGKPQQASAAETYLKGKKLSEEALLNAAEMIADLMLPDRYYKRYAIKGVLLDVFQRINK